MSAPEPPLTPDARRGGPFTRLYGWMMRASQHRRAPFWLGAVSFIGMIATFIARSYNEDVDYYVQPDEVERIENLHHANFEAPRQALNTQPVAEQI